MGKKHHHIPRFLLQNFTDTEGYIWVLDKQTGKIFSTRPKKIAYQNHLYSVEGSGGRKDDILEKTFSKIEEAAAPIIKKLVSEQKIPEIMINRHHLFYFLCCLAMRSPKFVKESNNPDIYDTRSYYQENFSSYTVKEYMKAQELLAAKKKIPNQIYSEAIWLTIELLIKFIADKFNVFLHFSKNDIILSGDYALKLYQCPIGGQSLKDINCIIFPIASSACVICVHKRLPCANSMPEVLHALGEDAGINMFTNYFAERYIYGASGEVLRQAAANAQAFAANLAASG